MKKIFAFTIAAIALLAVSCNKEVAPQQDRMVAKTFTVNAPESTKTELNGPKSVVWSKGDAITVIAKGSQNQYTFTIKNGDEGKTSAVFQGSIAEADKDETEFYAFYPATVTLDLNDKNYPLSSGNITVKSAPSEYIDAVKDGYDASRAYLTAISTGANDSFTFRHGMAYFKIKISYPGIKSVRFANSGSGKLGGRPSFSVEDGSTTALQGTKSFVELWAEDVLEKDATYYIPVTTRQSNIGKLDVTFYLAEASQGVTITTESLSSVKLQSGLIYDFGCPSVSFGPAVSAEDVSLEADATSGVINVEIINPTSDGVLSAALKEASDWLTVGSVSGTTVSLTSTANTGNVRSAIVVLTYTYDNGQTATAEVTVTQGGTEPEHYLWDFSSEEWQAEFGKKGNAGSDITNWDLTYDGLTIISAAKSKYREDCFQWGGKGSTEDRYMKFTVYSEGTVSVYAANTGSSVATDGRHVSLWDSTGKTQEAEACDVPSGSPKKYDFEVKKGDVKVFCSGNALKFYKIEFTSK